MSAKKAASVTRTNAKRAAVKKTAAKKAVQKKKPAKKKIAAKSKAVPKKKITTKSSGKKKGSVDTGSNIVKLPYTAPIRLQERAHMLRWLMDGRLDGFFINTARFGGLFLVIVGAFFTLFNYQLSGELTTAAVAQQQASTITNFFPYNELICLDPGDPAFSDYCSDYDTPYDECNPNYVFYKPENCDGTNPNTGSGSIDPDPPATFSLVKDVYTPTKWTISVGVPYATKVKLLALKTDTNTIVTLGLAVLVSADQWRYVWDTSQYQNGSYRLLAEITNQYGTYTADNSTAYTISNTTAPDPSKATFSLANNAVISGNTTVTVAAPGYEQADLYVRMPDNSTPPKLQQVTAAPGSWSFSWPTTNGHYPDGTYSLEAKLLYAGQVTAKQGPSVTIYNHTETTTPTTTTTTSTNTQTTTTSATTTTPTTPDKNNVTFSPASNQTVSGRFNFVVNAPGYDKVTVIMYPKSSSSAFPMQLNSGSSASGEWKFIWDTAGRTDGEYRGVAQLYYGTKVEEINTPVFTVKNTTSTVGSTTTVQTTNPSETSDAVGKKPQLTLPSDPLTGTVDIRVDSQASFVEVYARSIYATSPVFIGLAKQTAVGSTRWTLQYNTKNLANGSYLFTARANTSGGILVSDALTRKVSNEQTATVKTTATTETIALLEPTVTTTNQEVTFSDTDENSGSELRVASDSDINDITDKLMSQFKTELDIAIERYTSAVRSQDESLITIAKERLTLLRGKILDAALSDSDTKALTARIDERLQEEFERLQTRIDTVEMIVRERTDSAITLDTDGDGITDYDEITLYHTDPNLSDTDGDGFLDGAEIMNGFDPNDPAGEAMVRFESPQTTGLTRPDLFVVADVKPVVDEVASTSPATKALIRGTGLPNSIVTLYIFSTPAIVTLRTEADGSWEYQFDKELENGEHEVYVGVTDNAGKIVAKSEPYRFVKEAQAFTPVDAAATANITTESNNRLSSPNSLLTVISVTVVAIGLILILIGWNMEATRQKPVVVQTAT